MTEGSARHDAAPTERFAEAISRLDEELDWAGLGRAYCWEGGEDFFDAPDREAILEAGLLLAADLSEAVEALPREGLARSLYVGAGVAELAPMLCDRLVLGREVHALSLPGVEASELNRALAAVGAAMGSTLPRIEPRPLEEGLDGRFDLAWLVSVLTDPEAFPALHDHLYRRHGEGATGGGNLIREYARAERLLDLLLERLDAPCVLATTDEELALVERACERRERTLHVPEQARLSAIVGDPVRMCLLE